MTKKKNKKHVSKNREKNHQPNQKTKLNNFVDYTVGTAEGHAPIIARHQILRARKAK